MLTDFFSESVGFDLYFGENNKDIVGVADYGTYTDRFGTAWTGPLVTMFLPILRRYCMLTISSIAPRASS